MGTTVGTQDTSKGAWQPESYTSDHKEHAVGNQCDTCCTWRHATRREPQHVMHTGRTRKNNRSSNRRTRCGQPAWVAARVSPGVRPSGWPHHRPRVWSETFGRTAAGVLSGGLPVVEKVDDQTSQL